jgi:hypothetical protein
MNTVTTKEIKPGNVYTAIGEDKTQIPFGGKSFFVVEILYVYDNLIKMRLISIEGNKIYYLKNSFMFKHEE